MNILFCLNRFAEAKNIEEAIVNLLKTDQNNPNIEYKKEYYLEAFL